MIISLIGMSGTGKTHWARALEKKGFETFHCDELIEEKLEKHLKKLNFNGLRDVAKWMGQPFHKEYPETSKKYLEFETEVVKEVITKIVALPEDRNIVIDTTGSLIYIPEKIQQDLKRVSKVVFLDSPQAVKDTMYKLYIRDPKPVIWGDAFQPKNGESNYVALSRCYPKLLEYRTKKYTDLADITLDYFNLRSKKFNVDDFLQLVHL